MVPRISMVRSLPTSSYLNDQTLAPATVANAGVYWVAQNNTVTVPVPLNPPVGVPTDVPHFGDKQGRDYLVNITPTDPLYGWWICTNKGI